MQLHSSKRFTEPKLSPAKPKASDMQKAWYVWFRFFDDRERDPKKQWKQLRFTKGINKITTYKERLVEANALKQAIKEELRDGWNPLNPGAAPVKIYSLAEALDFMQKVKEATIKTKTRYAYKYILDCFREWLQDNGTGQVAARYFTTAQAQEYMDWLVVKKNYAGRTFNDHLIVLRTFFNCFIEREWVDKNPFRAVKKKSQTVGRNIAYTEYEKEKLSDYLLKHDRRMYYFTQFMYHCFIRRTELTYIKVRHVDMINKTIIIPGETAKNRTQESVVIPPDLEPVIREMDLGKYSGDDYVFGRSLKTGPTRFKNPNWISGRHNRVVKQLGIDSEKGLYSHKHTGVCAYYYLTGKDIYSLMRQLRHRDMSTTMIYLKSLGLVQNDAFRNASAA